MNRRDILKFLGAATAASIGGIALLDTKKTFFLPPKGGWNGALRTCRQWDLTDFEGPIIDPLVLEISGWASGSAGLNVGDVLTVGEWPRTQFVVVQAGEKIMVRG